MPDYGLIAKNSASEIQIDSTYRNYCKQSEGTNTITNNNTLTDYYTTIPIISSSLIPLVLIRPDTDYFAAVRSYEKSGDNYTGIRFTTEVAKSSIIDWKSYRETPESSAENYGLRIYNPVGSLVFDSGKAYFKIFSVYTINLANPTTNTYPYTDITHSDISNPFYILSPGSFWLYVAPGPVSGLAAKMIGLKKLSATSIRVGWFRYYGAALPPDLSEDSGYNTTQKLIVCKV